MIKINGKKQNADYLISGLPGIGLVGKIVVDYLIYKLKPVKIAEIYSDNFPPLVQSVKGVLEPIKLEMFYKKIKGKGIIFLAGPVQPSIEGRGAGKEHFEFSEIIIKEAKKRKVKQIITLAGINIGQKRVLKKPSLWIVGSSSKNLKKFMKEFDIKNIYEQAISGAAGIFITEGYKKKIEGICLMGETSAQMQYGDVGASRVVLDSLEKFFKFGLKYDDLDKDVKKLEEEFAKINKSVEEVKEENPSYIR